MLLTKKEINSIVKKIEKNIEINIQGQHDKALNSYLELWESLPEPKQEQPEQISNWLINCIFNNYFDRESFLEAKKWAEKLSIMTQPKQEPMSIFKWAEFAMN